MRFWARYQQLTFFCVHLDSAFVVSCAMIYTHSVVALSLHRHVTEGFSIYTTLLYITVFKSVPLNHLFNNTDELQLSLCDDEAFGQS